MSIAYPDLGPRFTRTPDGFLHECSVDTADAIYHDTARRPLPWRYQLRRYRTMQSQLGRVCVVCGLNPSTATALVDDATIRRCSRVSWFWGCDIYTMVNAYAWRDTKPANMWAALKRGENIMGERNDQSIVAALQTVQRSGGIAVAAWGTHCPPGRSDRLRELASVAGVAWQCLGYNAGGSPRHPLYVANGTPLVPWPRPEPDQGADVHFTLAEANAAARTFYVPNWDDED